LDPNVRKCYWNRNETFYFWEERADEEGFISWVCLYIPLPAGTVKRDLKVVLNTKNIEVRVKGKPIIKGRVRMPIQADESVWEIEKYYNLRVIRIGMKKLNVNWLWEWCVEGERNIMTGKTKMASTKANTVRSMWNCKDPSELWEPVME